MSMKINRRKFLAALAGVGAAVVLPANPSEADIDAAWHRLLEDPWLFGVDERGVIIEPGATPPRVNADVYESISVSWLEDPKSLIDEIDQYDELRSHFQALFASHVEGKQAKLDDEISELEIQLEEETEGSEQAEALSRRIATLRKALDALDPYEYDGWKSWVEESGAAGVPGFKDEVGKWLQKPVNWLATESWPEGWSGQCRALSFFQDQEFAMLKALGIVVVEGDRPGSTYYAAELRGSIEDANAAAARLELPFRFRRAMR